LAVDLQLVFQAVAQEDCRSQFRAGELHADQWTRVRSASDPRSRSCLTIVLTRSSPQSYSGML
jgi:hypothetical protein